MSGQQMQAAVVREGKVRGDHLRKRVPGVVRRSKQLEESEGEIEGFGLRCRSGWLSS